MKVIISCGPDIMYIKYFYVRCDSTYEVVE